MSQTLSYSRKFHNNIKSSGLSIYDKIEVGDPKFWIPPEIIQSLLLVALRGISLEGLPLRTRSKVVKEAVCKALGYPIPSTFKRVKPRIPGQCLDVYIQKSNNLQIWNAEVSPNRRYAIIKVSDQNVIVKVRVLDGASLSLIETTGTLTRKHQAGLGPLKPEPELVSKLDTEVLRKIMSSRSSHKIVSDSPTDQPTSSTILTIGNIFDKLKTLVGCKFDSVGSDQERGRGGLLHKLVCQTLGYGKFSDNGRFPDVLHQLLEIKLQTSPTIDLGIVSPGSLLALDVSAVENLQLRHCDVRYAIFCGSIMGKVVTIENLILSTGEDFFSRFRPFAGGSRNKKIQIKLPANFFFD